MVYSLLKNPGRAPKRSGFDRAVVQPIADLGDTRKQRYRRAHPHVWDVVGRAAAFVPKEGLGTRSPESSRVSALARIPDGKLSVRGGRCSGRRGTIIVTASGEVRRA